MSVGSTMIGQLYVIAQQTVVKLQRSHHVVTSEYQERVDDH